MDYLTVLQELHVLLKPDVYLEIGVERGHSLALSRSKTIGVDPALAVTAEAVANQPWTKLYRCTSDAFFHGRHRDAVLEGGHLGLAFIDGLHLFEQVLRDLINVERWASPGSVIVLHDVIPPDVPSARRSLTPTAYYWAGDVWKIVPCLSRYRPDLLTTVVSAPPSGLLVIRRADPSSTVLERRYQEIVDAFVGTEDGWEREVAAYLAALKPTDPVKFLGDLAARFRPH